MNRRIFALQLAGTMVALARCTAYPADAAIQTKRLLVLSQTAGYRHDSIPNIVAALRALGSEQREWEVVEQADTAEQVSRAITAARLREVDGVVFASTTGTLAFTPEGRTAFYDWMRAGGSFIGVHSATDTFHGDAAYLGLIGGEFENHGPQVEVEARVQDPRHPATAGLPASFPFFDEIYEFKNFRRSDVHVLLSMPRHPQTRTPGDFPLAWTRRYGNGRMFYTALGHRTDAYSNPLFLRHLAGGSRWALGLAPGDDSKGNPIV
jgi:uncharacterized protein